MVTTSSATSAPSSAVINRPNPVSVGTIVWLGSEVMFFAGIFAVYFTLRSTSPGLWEHHSESLNVWLSLGITIILVASSFTAQFGVFAAERMQPYRTGTLFQVTKWGAVEWFYASFILGAIFIVGQVYEYALLVSHGFGFGTDSFTSAFFFATGFHGLHVTGGLIAMLLVIGRIYAAKNFTHKEATSTIVVSYYWHFVDVVWIALFLVIYVLK